MRVFPIAETLTTYDDMADLAWDVIRDDLIEIIYNISPTITPLLSGYPLFASALD